MAWSKKERRTFMFRWWSIILWPSLLGLIAAAVTWRSCQILLLFDVWGLIFMPQKPKLSGHQTPALCTWSTPSFFSDTKSWSRTVLKPVTKKTLKRKLKSTGFVMYPKYIGKKFISALSDPRINSFIDLLEIGSVTTFKSENLNLRDVFVNKKIVKDILIHSVCVQTTSLKLRMDWLCQVLSTH